MADKKTDTPVADIALQPYWDAAARGKLLIKHCPACGRNHYYPRPICPHCFGDKTEWLETSGEGTIYSWSVERRANPPYSIAYVTLPEGVSLLTSIVDCDFDALSVGQKVKLAFEQRDGQPTPVFRPA
ncbi:Zn-ribbon domain-containing OB-fold protein [Vineibacter terrae]|uniref:Zn-ribbon domain-containing OB-fold protein n=1 Tax=Vineibacter terrae TaxID=2586908 RepID=UPI002E30641A|nr:Zn-ribbon domain-containing OB-fold protein [Vineibacter terrae]HEX2891042.1 Zn-ribbon domain-containing OB-fold protein [Vineibacter terrae]